MSYLLPQTITIWLTVAEIEFEVVSEKRQRELEQMWRQHFSKSRKRLTGKWCDDDTDWHTFSHRYTKALRGTDAENAFNGTGATCLTFISSNRRIPALLCQSQKPVDTQVVRDLIEREPSVLDLYIFPPNFEWTVVFTHEDTWNCIFARGDDDL